MIHLNKVTITGADDATDIGEMLDLSAKYPFVEWGILVSKHQEGSPRFPSRPWIYDFAVHAVGKKLAVSTHVCGEWVRQLFTGDLDWMELPAVISMCQRVQINTHAEPHVSNVGLMTNLRMFQDKQCIFQWDGVNDHLTWAARAYGVDIAALFDQSGGAGILPKLWPLPRYEFPCGYAGGLGPDNVVEQVKIIERICDQPYWIDMERRVRTDDDKALDMQRVRSVLEQVDSMLKNNQR